MEYSLNPQDRQFWFPVLCTLCGLSMVTLPYLFLADGQLAHLFLGVLLIGIFLCQYELGVRWALIPCGLAMLLMTLGLDQLPRPTLAEPYTDAAGNQIFASVNLAKAGIAGIVLLYAFITCPRPSPRQLLQAVAAAAAVLAVGAFAVGVSPKISSTILMAALINLLVVCVSEEGFFRLIVQRGLDHGLARWQKLQWLSPLLVTLLFVVLHGGWAASPMALVLVGVAAATYAGIWHRTRNFWACVAVHFTVNLGHLLLLPYPLA